MSSSGLSNITIAIISLVTAIVSAIGTQLYNDYVSPPISESTANVHQQDGVFVFIRSLPSYDYTPLGVINENTVGRAIGATKGKKGKQFWNSLAKTLVTDVTSFSGRLSSIVGIVKTSYPQADGVLFSDDLTECTVIKFKK
jgi:hypothetical protein